MSKGDIILMCLVSASIGSVLTTMCFQKIFARFVKIIADYREITRNYEQANDILMQANDQLVETIHFYRGIHENAMPAVRDDYKH